MQSIEKKLASAMDGSKNQKQKKAHVRNFLKKLFVQLQRFVYSISFYFPFIILHPSEKVSSNYLIMFQLINV